ncbi:hypothetical protein NUU61_005665 [Penicillium alfredii]|uniref:Aminoglycoside phosphotransferase domain-containing protein n=1 Tax=Penicillium alfredii TaxID=1506179 RepID=A0A9W9F9Z5_9EURO|nr:uncharacterized protein NUU61_005665 [Penicillium alfredii]KAJ5096309.1 hypothetical protein NUU61_005665 [Penicillium alfredii]
MDFDDISLDEFDKLKQDWGICEPTSRYRHRDDCLLHSMHCGSFNFSFRLYWDDGAEDWLIRFPLPGKSMILDEKVCREALLMQYVANNTSIPVPRVIAYGAASENPTGLGSFLIMTWIEGKKMSDLLRKEGDACQRKNTQSDHRPADLANHLWTNGGNSARALGSRL